MENNLIERITNLGIGIDGFGTFNLHHVNGKTNIMAAVSEKQLLLKYEHFEHKDGTTLFIIYKAEDGKYNKTIFKALKNGTSDDSSEDMDKKEFFKEIEKIISLIEMDPSDLDYIITPDLYDKYKKFRNFFEIIKDETQIYDWNSVELLDYFNNDLWENRESPKEPVDINIETFVELNEIYKQKEKSDHRKPILRIVTNEKKSK